MVVVVVALTAGSAFLMWVGEQINEKGVGNGISIVLLINIVSRIPSDMTKLYESFMKGKTVAKSTALGRYYSGDYCWGCNSGNYPERS